MKVNFIQLPNRAARACGLLNERRDEAQYMHKTPRVAGGSNLRTGATHFFS
jgi:hypothetical protein